MAITGLLCPAWLYIVFVGAPQDKDHRGPWEDACARVDPHSKPSGTATVEFVAEVVHPWQRSRSTILDLVCWTYTSVIELQLYWMIGRLLVL